jgi:hypothetical protein
MVYMMCLDSSVDGLRNCVKEQKIEIIAVSSWFDYGCV